MLCLVSATGQLGCKLFLLESVCTYDCNGEKNVAYYALAFGLDPIDDMPHGEKRADDDEYSVWSEDGDAAIGPVVLVFCHGEGSPGKKHKQEA